MNTSFTLSLSELNVDFLKTIKSAFKNEREITISISSQEDFELNKPETKAGYINRILKAKANLEKGKGIVYTESELNELYINTLL